MPFLGQDLTDIHKFTTDELLYVMDKAATMKKAIEARDTDVYQLAAKRDMIAALLFFENSTRTRTSFEIAAMRLGMRTTGFPSAETTSVKKGESLRHTLDMYEAFNCDAVIMRHHLDGSARFAASHLGIPVFNAGDGKHEHPTQTILDLFTIREHLGRLEDFDIGISGDLKYGRTAHSLVIALSKFGGIRIHLYSPGDLEMPEAFLKILEEKGVEVKIHESLHAMAPRVDILYQTRIQKERFGDRTADYEKARGQYIIDNELMKAMKKEAIVMHPLPRVGEIDPEVDNDPRAAYFRQAQNGLYIRMALLKMVLWD